MRFFFILALLLIVKTANGQFYTIKKKQPLIEVKSVRTEKKAAANPIPFTIKDTQKEHENIFFHLPLLSKYVITSPYGYRTDPFTAKKKFHYGIDLSASNNEKVYSMTNGRIKKVGFEKNGYGNYIVIESGDFEFTYAHLTATVGKKGTYIKAGTPIGLSGSTGRSTGEHLHLTIKHKKKSIDPMPILNYYERYIKEVREKVVI